MTVRSQWYNTVPGTSEITIPELAFRKIVSVKREGKGFNIKVDEGLVLYGSRDVKYRSTMGKFTFLNEFIYTYVDMGSYDLLVPEKIFIIWEE